VCCYFGWNWPINLKIPSTETSMVDQQAVTKAIGVAQSTARGGDAAAAAATVCLARDAGVDAVKLLHCLIRDDRAVLAQRTRAAVALLEVGGFLGGAFSPELRSGTVFREGADGNGASGRDAP
jgi:hypothetical protein